MISLVFIEIELRVYMCTCAYACTAVFHTKGGVPWDFPPLALISPLKFSISTVYNVRTLYYFSTPMALDPLSICLRKNYSV